ncbi:biotin--[acetyl-CoA-carboxylase] ligase [Sulfurimonas sp.]|uniref:biotin--[acetyl-CoA-carboxylase] ligase n=1 Tax=Sulfurimonas sp. TaxID=2022749 RepID=UPI0025F7A64B|nr:biotin--[acetyl-CoA-carboxylase] ligase [Sulfurimonas sp.]MBT5935399.1 biotin--[acetyl-CoA-carboxylase] ligase [Sulfurimonas sp.]
MKTLFFKSLPSTQTYLKNLLKQDKTITSIAVVAGIQTAGIGSRDNSWNSIEGNLFLSFSMKISDLPKDLKIESASIYFSYLLKETLSELGSKVLVKWPNDLYLRDKKIAGMITNIVDDRLVCGVGVNLVSSPTGFGHVDIEIRKEILLKNYFKNIAKKVLWKQVFSKYKLEYYTNKNLYTHVNGAKIHLNNTELQDDGSLKINGERIYSLR